MSGDSTRARLAAAAVALIEEQGILSGFTLQEVAQRAGVSPGNIYHHFGSRQALLRESIRPDEEVAGRWSATAAVVPFVERHLPWFRGSRVMHRDAKLSALLAIDGDDTADPMPSLEQSVSDLRQSVIDGAIHPAHDLPALQVVMLCLRRGYQIFRRPMARRIGITMTELDDRVTAIVRHCLGALTEPPVADEAEAAPPD